MVLTQSERITRKKDDQKRISRKDKQRKDKQKRISRKDNQKAERISAERMTNRKDRRWISEDLFVPSMFLIFCDR